MSNKLYAGAYYARQVSEINIVIGGTWTLAPSKEAAEEDLLDHVKTKHPEGDGWSTHLVQVKELPKPYLLKAYTNLFVEAMEKMRDEEGEDE